ncbi:hypothetical protein RCL1_008022 [Eukaryota sp. TZLM3-RCL]
MTTCKFPGCSSSLSDYKSLQVIGAGAQGKVFLVIDKEGNRFCLKRINSSSSTFASESLAFLKKVCSPYLVQTHHGFQDEDFDHLVMELCEGGPLHLFPELNGLSTDDIWLICTQVVKALADLHSNGVVHRDVKPSNVLLVSQERPLRVKLADFGIARDLDGRTIKTSIGTPQFMAPEMFNSASHGAPVDLFALGVLIYFLVEKTYPFTSMMETMVSEAPISNSEFGELVSSLLQKDPSKRPTAFQLLQHPKIIEYSDDFLAPCSLNDVFLLRRRVRSLENSAATIQEQFSSFQLSINSRFDSEIAIIKSKHDAEVACLYQKLTTIESKLCSTEAQLEQVTKNYQDQISSLTQSHKDSINSITRQHVLDTEKLNKEVARLSQLVDKLQGGISDLEISNQKFRYENVAFKNEMKNSTLSPEVVVDLLEQGQRIREQQCIEEQRRLEEEKRKEVERKAREEAERREQEAKRKAEADRRAREEVEKREQERIEGLKRSFMGNRFLMAKVPKLNGEPDWDKLGEVKELGLGGNRELTCLEGIQLFTGLTTLALNSTNVSNVSPLSSLTNLRELDLNSTNVSTVSPLSSLTNLRELYLSSTNVSDVSPLSSLTKLTTLGLSSTNVSDVSPLSSLTKLRELYLSSTNVSDVSPLSSLTKLTTLDVDSTNVSDVSPLSSLTELTTLGLSSTNVSDGSPLSSLTELTMLGLSSTKVSDVSPLSSLTNLRELYLSSTNVSNVSPLSSLTKLTTLELISTNVSDVSPLSSLTKLTTLDVDSTNVSDVSPLSSLTELTTLGLSSTKVSNVSPLSGLTELTWLNLKSTNVRNTSCLSHLNQLRVFR